LGGRPPIESWYVFCNTTGTNQQQPDIGNIEIGKQQPFNPNYKIMGRPHSSEPVLSTMAKKMNKLPETDSITALAEFWQTHDLTDFEDALVEVTEPVFQRAERLSVSLPAADLAALRARARQEHTPETALVSKWIHERLHAG